MIAPRVESVFRDLVGILDEAQVPYMVMGGFAVIHWAVERATFDVDFTISCGEKDVERLFDRLEARGYMIPDPYRKGFRVEVKGLREFKVQWYADGRPWDADFFLVSMPYQEEAFTRRVQIELLGVKTWIISAEDLILHKLYAGRLKDLADVVDILTISRVDLGYVRLWAERLKVAEQLDECLQSAGEMGP